MSANSIRNQTDEIPTGQTHGSIRLPGPVGSHITPLSGPDKADVPSVQGTGDDWPFDWKIDRHELHLWFDPAKSDKNPDAKVINFQQICKIFVQRKGSNRAVAILPSELNSQDAKIDNWCVDKWFIDENSLHHAPYYVRQPHHGSIGKSTNGISTKALLIDRPGVNGNRISLEWFEHIMYDEEKDKKKKKEKEKEKEKEKYLKIIFHFQTFAVCQQGNDGPPKEPDSKRQWYEGMHWVWEVTSKQVHHPDRPGDWRGQSRMDEPLFAPKNEFLNALKKYRQLRLP